MKNKRSQGIFALLVTTSVLVWIIPAASQTTKGDIRVVFESKHDVSLPLRKMAQNALRTTSAMSEKEERRAPAGYFVAGPGIDPVVQDHYLPQVAMSGLSSFDGLTGRQGGTIPPDTNGRSEERRVGK